MTRGLEWCGPPKRAAVVIAEGLWAAGAAPAGCLGRALAMFTTLEAIMARDGIATLWARATLARHPRRAVGTAGQSRGRHHVLCHVGGERCAGQRQVALWPGARLESYAEVALHLLPGGLVFRGDQRDRLALAVHAAGAADTV